MSMTNEGAGREGDLFEAAVRYAPTLGLLADGPKSRRELESALGVSKATVHRTTTAISDIGLAERIDDVYQLTALGETVQREVSACRARIRLADDLGPLLQSATRHGVDLDAGLLATATVTEASPNDPYGPMRRLFTLLSDTESLRGFDVSALDPLTVGQVARRIHDGMPTELIYRPAVLSAVLDGEPEHAEGVLGSGRLAVWTCEELPFGLLLFDDRVCLTGSDPETGTLAIAVDTADVRAIDWAESLYEQYRRRANPTPTTAVTDATARSRRGSSPEPDLVTDRG